MAKKIKLPVQNEITTDIIDYVIQEHQDEAARINKLKSDYDNDSEILKRVIEDTTKPNNKLPHAYCAYITDMATGHFLGVPIAYKSDNEQLMNRIAEINDYNDEADNNTSIATWQSICGYGVELVYSDEEANVRFSSINPSEVAIVYDMSISESIQFAVRYFNIPSIDGKNKQQVEVYTNDDVTVYIKDGDKYTLADVAEGESNPKEHFFGQVPFSVYANNNDMKGDFEKVIHLINAYNKTQSDTANDFEYFTDAYLKVIGATLDEETAQQLKRKRVINLPDENSDASFLTKDINDTALENYKNRINADIHKFSFLPDITSEGFTASLSGEALKFKFAALNNICKTKQNKFKKGLMRRFELICNFLSIKEATEYTSIVPVFTLNMPKNNMDIATLVNMLEGKLSLETRISMLDGIEDANFEIEKLKKEGVVLEDLNKVNSQAMSRKAFLVKHFGLSDEEAKKELKQIQLEKQMLEEGYSSMEADTENIEEVVEDEV